MILKGSKQYFYWVPRSCPQREDDWRQEIATLEKEIAALRELRLKNLARDTRDPAPGPIRFPWPGR